MAARERVYEQASQGAAGRSGASAATATASTTHPPTHPAAQTSAPRTCGCQWKGSPKKGTQPASGCHRCWGCRRRPRRRRGGAGRGRSGSEAAIKRHCWRRELQAQRGRGKVAAMNVNVLSVASAGLNAGVVSKQQTPDRRASALLPQALTRGAVCISCCWAGEARVTSMDGKLKLWLRK